MPRKPSPALTDVESHVMAVLWQIGRGTVSDVVDGLRGRHPVTYSTAQTMLRILETKGYVRHDKVRRAFVYAPVVDQSQARRRALRHLVSRLFNDSPSLLVLNILGDEQIDQDEMRRLKQLIEDA